MRFYRPANDSTLELRHPRSWLFLFGPFYLLWLRLWVEAVVVAAAVWTVVRGATALTRSVTGASDGFDMGRALAALDVMRASAGRTPEGDEAFRQLLAMSLPIYAAGFALVCAMVVLSALFPRYLRWRFGLRGWLLAGEAGTERVSPESSR